MTQLQSTYQLRDRQASMEPCLNQLTNQQHGPSIYLWSVDLCTVHRCPSVTPHIEFFYTCEFEHSQNRMTFYWNGLRINRWTIVSYHTSTLVKLPQLSSKVLRCSSTVTTYGPSIERQNIDCICKLVMQYFLVVLLSCYQSVFPVKPKTKLVKITTKRL